MSAGVVVLTKPKIDLDRTCYCQNVAAEHGAGAIKKLTRKTDCLLQELISWDQGGTPRFHSASSVLSEIRKAKAIAAEIDDDPFEYGKDAFLEDISELEMAVSEADEKGVKVSLWAA